MRAVGTAKISKIVAAFLLAALLCAAFCACNTVQPEGDGNAQYYIQLTGYSVDTDNFQVDITVNLNGDPTTSTGSDKAVWASRVYNVNAFYSRQSITITLNPKSVYEALIPIMQNEDFSQYPPAEYRLNIALRYDTIYKSLKSDGRVLVAGRYYLHFFDLDRDVESQSFNMSLDLPRSEGWYSVLIACGVLLFIALMAISLVVAKRKRRGLIAENPADAATDGDEISQNSEISQDGGEISQDVDKADENLIADNGQNSCQDGDVGDKN